MINVRTIARPYAKAVLALAIEQNNFAQWSQWLDFLSQVICDQRVSALVSNLAIAPQRKVELLSEIGKGYLSTEAMNLVKLLAYAKRLQIIPTLYGLYEELRRVQQHQVLMDVTVAMPLEQIERVKVDELISEQINGESEINYMVDEKLLAGGLLQIGDRVIDASLRSRLMLLKQQLVE